MASDIFPNIPAYGKLNIPFNLIGHFVDGADLEILVMIGDKRSIGSPFKNFYPNDRLRGFCIPEIGFFMLPEFYFPFIADENQAFAGINSHGKVLIEHL
jgi:hypothetical protein